MQAAEENAFLAELLENTLAPDEKNKDNLTQQQRSWLIRLPLVYTQNASQHFEEQLILSLDTLTRWLTELDKGNITYARTRVCIRQLQELSSKRIEFLQNLDTAMQLKQ